MKLDQVEDFELDRENEYYDGFRTRRRKKKKGHEKREKWIQFLIPIVSLIVVVIACVALVKATNRLIEKNGEQSSQQGILALKESIPGETGVVLDEDEIGDGDMESSEAETTDIDLDDGPVEIPMMGFAEVFERVAATSKVNVRDFPGTGENSNVLYTLATGEIVFRTGVNRDENWSRVIYDGDTYYVSSKYLTTTLPVAEPQIDPETGLPIPPAEEETNPLASVFEECDERVKPKDTLSLRSAPNLNPAESVVAYILEPNAIMVRTGICKETGWSRILYEDHELYCFTIYLEDAPME